MSFQGTSFEPRFIPQYLKGQNSQVTREASNHVRNYSGTKCSWYSVELETDWGASLRFHKQPKTWIHMLDKNKPEEVAESTLCFPSLFSLPALSSWLPHKMGRVGKVRSPPQSRSNWEHNSGRWQLHGLKEKEFHPENEPPCYCLHRFQPKTYCT